MWILNYFRLCGSDPLLASRPQTIPATHFSIDAGVWPGIHQYLTPNLTFHTAPLNSAILSLAHTDVRQLLESEAHHHKVCPIGTGRLIAMVGVAHAEDATREHSMSCLG